MTALPDLIRRNVWKVGAVGAALALVLAFAVTAAQASGDAFGDTSSDEDGVAGSADDALGTPDGTSVEIGTEDAGGGSLTITFDDNFAYDGTGADIRVHADSDGTAASAEIEVSQDGSTFVSAGVFSDAADADIDLGSLGLTFARAVRVTYEDGDFPGYGLDAVETLNGIGEATVLDASPETAENPSGTDHTVTAEVTDDDEPIAGVLVSFAVAAGPNDGEDGTENTDASGDAEFTYTDEGGAGTDVIVAWLDLDGDGDVDADEPRDEVTKDWQGATGTIELADVNGGELEVGDTVLVTVTDADLDTTDDPDEATVTITSTADGTGFPLELTETGDHTGVFVGSFTVAAATDADEREIEADVDDEVTGTYTDDLDGAGEGPEERTASLTVGDDATDEDDAANGEQVTVCHMPPGNPGNARTLTIGASAEEAHRAHGDTPGECDEEELAPTRQEQQRDAFCEKRPDHRRCDDQESSSASITAEDEETSTASTASEDQDKRNDEGAGKGEDARQSDLRALCERKPDHPPCDDLDEGETHRGRPESAGNKRD